jgi:diphosphomevalonate decarboxylase
MQASAVAHPNVALIKYWGKRDAALNMPATSSLSLTLSGMATTTRVEFSPEFTADQVLVNGQPDVNADNRVSRCLDELRGLAGVAQFAKIESTNNFPTGAGLASSASGYAALVTAGAAALNLELAPAGLENIARLGSGSAPRSLFDGIVLLENQADSIRCETISSANDWPLSVVVAITSRGHKKIASTEGMERSRTTSPYYNQWLASHADDISAGLECVAQRDFTRLAELSEHSCLKMHALAMSSRPSMIYWNPATIACMHRVQELREDGLPVFFTIDAGPQIKAVCLPEAVDQVKAALSACDGVIELRECQLGAGARVTT